MRCRCELNQVVVTGTEQRAAQRLRQRQVLRVRGQRVEHGQQVAHRRRRHQGQRFGCGPRQVQGRQLLRHPAQRSAFATEDEDVARRHGLLQHQLAHRQRHLPRLLLAQRFLGLIAWRGQAVAPDQGIVLGGARLRFQRPQSARQHGHAGIRFRGHVGGVFAEAVELARCLGLLKDRIQHSQHGRRVAAGVVTGQHVALQAVQHEVARRFEDPRLGAPEAVDALLRIADDEHPRRCLAAGAAPGPGVTRQPGVQRLPLQRAGVLELVDHHVADARVEALLQPARQAAIAQQRQRTAFEVGHVGQAAGPLVACELIDQQARQAQHAQVFIVRGLLVAGALDVVQASHRVIELRGVQLLAQLALLREQRGACGGQCHRCVCMVQRPFQRPPLLAGNRALGSAEVARQTEQQRPHGARMDVLGRVRQTGEFGPLRRGARHAGFECAGRVGELDLDAFLQRGVQPLAQLRAPAQQHLRVEVGTRGQVGDDRRMKTPIHLGQVFVQVFDQIHVGLQSQLGQHVHRRGAQQLREPGVEGANLDRATARQHALVQPRQCGFERAGISVGQAAQAQGLHAIFDATGRRADSSRAMEKFVAPARPPSIE